MGGHQHFILLLLCLVMNGFVWAKGKGGSGGNKTVIVDLSDGQNATTVSKGDTLQIICVGHNEPFETSRTSWWKNYTEIEDVQQYPRYEISKIGLTINKIKQSDAGLYQCILADEQNHDVYIHRNITINVTKKRTESNNTKRTGKVKVDTTTDYDEDEDMLQDAIIGCDIVMSAPGFKESAPYLCFDLNQDGKKMNRYFLRAAGSSLTLFCNPRGNPKPSVKWLKDDEPFSPQGYHYKINNHSLMMREVTESDSASYTCEAYNSHSTIQYHTTVQVQGRETDKILIEKLANVTTLVGEDLQVNCIVLNEEDTHGVYIWFVKDDGKRLQVSHAKPIFTEAPKNLTMMQMGNALLRVEILSDAEYYVKWMKHSLENPERYHAVESRTENETLLSDPHILYLENVTLDDAGWYTCLVTNSIGRSNMSVYVDVVTEVPMPNDKIARHGPEIFKILLIAIPVAGVGLLLMVFGIWFISSRYQANRFKNKMQLQGSKGWTKVVVVERVPARGCEQGSILIPEVNIKSVVTNRNNGQEYELPTDERWEFPRDRLIIGKYLGEGAFGEVCQATAHGILERGITTTVAVKTLKNTHSDVDMIDLISEMETMKELGKHPNIINLLGCCTPGGELLVIMEFAEHGSLLEFLRTNRHNYTYEKPKLNSTPAVVYMNGNDRQTPPGKHDLTFRDLMSYSYQVARGMDYLAQRKYVHRDLAARNILIAANHVAKICDFGMTRSTSANDYYRKQSDGRVPIKWMAPETLIHRVYTTQSDVWSYGILLWEIVTLGGSPYPTIPDMNYLLEFIRSGQRMSQPPNCPTELYLLMRDCWMDAPTARPIFGHLVEDIGRILYIASETEYFELEGAGPPEEIITPPSSPENSNPGIMFDPEFIKSFTES